MRPGRSRSDEVPAAPTNRRRSWPRLVGAIAAGAATLALAGGGPTNATNNTNSTNRADEPTGDERLTDDGAAMIRPRALADRELGVIDQTFNVDPDGSFEVTLALPIDVNIADLDERAVLVVTSHRAIPDRDKFQRSTKGELTRNEDTFDISLDPSVADPNRIALGDGSISIRVPTESFTRTPDALQLSQAGVHPVVLELRVANRPVGDVTTYVNRLPTVASTSGPLAISLIIRPLSLPVIGSDGSVAISDTARDELTLLSQGLTALNEAAAANGSGLPRGVQVEPSLLQAVVDTDPELAGALLPGLAAGDIIAAPRLPLDPSAVAAAGEATRYGTWLRQGEDILGGILPSTEIDRSVALVDERLSSDGAALQRNLGTQLLVLPWDFYTDLPGNIDIYTDISQLLTVELGDGQTVPAAILDDFLGAQMVRGADQPVLTSVEIAAELVVLARDIDIDAGVVSQHGVVLALPDLGVPDATFMSELARRLLESPTLRLVTPRELGTGTTTLLVDGQLVTLTFPDDAGLDISSRLQRLDDVTADVLAYASMLPDGASDIARWSATLEAFPSTALTDEQADAAVDRLNDDFAAYRTAIVAPEPFAFTLTGRESKLRFSLGNTSDQTIRVRVNLSSPKMRFPNGDQVVEIAGGSETELVIDVEALSNGKSSVFLRVYAPAENRNIELVPEVVLTARVNSLAGLGQLITGASLLLVITWWAHHARSDRRKALATRHQSRHPTAHRDPPATAQAGEVSLDAAASSLPPS